MSSIERNRGRVGNQGIRNRHPGNPIQSGGSNRNNSQDRIQNRGNSGGQGRGNINRNSGTHQGARNPNNNRNFFKRDNHRNRNSNRKNSADNRNDADAKRRKQEERRANNLSNLDLPSAANNEANEDNVSHDGVEDRPLQDGDPQNEGPYSEEGRSSDGRGDDPVRSACGHNPFGDLIVEDFGDISLEESLHIDDDGNIIEPNEVAASAIDKDGGPLEGGRDNVGDRSANDDDGIDFGDEDFNASNDADNGGAIDEHPNGNDVNVDFGIAEGVIAGEISPIDSSFERAKEDVLHKIDEITGITQDDEIERPGRKNHQERRPDRRENRSDNRFERPDHRTTFEREKSRAQSRPRSRSRDRERDRGKSVRRERDPVAHGSNNPTNMAYGKSSRRDGRDREGSKDKRVDNVHDDSGLPLCGTNQDILSSSAIDGCQSTGKTHVSQTKARGIVNPIAEERARLARRVSPTAFIPSVEVQTKSSRDALLNPQVESLDGPEDEGEIIRPKDLKKRPSSPPKEKNVSKNLATASVGNASAACGNIITNEKKTAIPVDINMDPADDQNDKEYPIPKSYTNPIRSSEASPTRMADRQSWNELVKLTDCLHKLKDALMMPINADGREGAKAGRSIDGTYGADALVPDAAIEPLVEFIREWQRKWNDVWDADTRYRLIIIDKIEMFRRVPFSEYRPPYTVDEATKLLKAEKDLSPNTVQNRAENLPSAAGGMRRKAQLFMGEKSLCEAKSPPPKHEPREKYREKLHKDQSPSPSPARSLSLDAQIEFKPRVQLLPKSNAASSSVIQTQKKSEEIANQVLKSSNPSRKDAAKGDKDNDEGKGTKSRNEFYKGEGNHGKGETRQRGKGEKEDVQSFTIDDVTVEARNLFEARRKIEELKKQKDMPKRDSILPSRFEIESSISKEFSRNDRSGPEHKQNSISNVDIPAQGERNDNRNVASIEKTNDNRNDKKRAAACGAGDDGDERTSKKMKKDPICVYHSTRGKLTIFYPDGRDNACEDSKLFIFRDIQSVKENAGKNLGVIQKIFKLLNNSRTPATGLPVKQIADAIGQESLIPQKLVKPFLKHWACIFSMESENNNPKVWLRAASSPQSGSAIVGLAAYELASIELHRMSKDDTPAARASGVSHEGRASREVRGSSVVPTGPRYEVSSDQSIDRIPNAGTNTRRSKSVARDRGENQPQNNKNRNRDRVDYHRNSGQGTNENNDYHGNDRDGYQGVDRNRDRDDHRKTDNVSNMNMDPTRRDSGRDSWNYDDGKKGGRDSGNNRDSGNKGDRDSGNNGGNKGGHNAGPSHNNGDDALDKTSENNRSKNNQSKGGNNKGNQGQGSQGKGSQGGSNQNQSNNYHTQGQNQVHGNNKEVQGRNHQGKNSQGQSGNNQGKNNQNQSRNQKQGGNQGKNQGKGGNQSHHQSQNQGYNQRGQNQGQQGGSGNNQGGNNRNSNQAGNNQGGNKNNHQKLSNKGEDTQRNSGNQRISGNQIQRNSNNSQRSSSAPAHGNKQGHGNSHGGKNRR